MTLYEKVDYLHNKFGGEGTLNSAPPAGTESQPIGRVRYDAKLLRILVDGVWDEEWEEANE